MLPLNRFGEHGRRANYWINGGLLCPGRQRQKKMDFREGGSWLYAMEGPAGEQHWSRADFQKIEPRKGFVGVDYFCDEQGNKNTEMPVMHWANKFSETGEGTKVEVVITFESEL